MCCHNLLSLWGTTETQLRAGTTPSGTRPRPLRFALQAQNFSAIWLHPKLTQKEFHKPGRYYQDKVNAAWSTVPSGGVGCIASSPTAPGKGNVLHFFPWLTPGLGTSFSWASLCLKISFPYVLASTKVWPGPAAHQAEMGFWQCHVCSLKPFSPKGRKTAWRKQSLLSFSPLCRPASFSSIFAIFLIHPKPPLLNFWKLRKIHTS